MPPKRKRRKQPDQSLSPLRKRKKRLVPLLMSTERNKLLAPRVFSLQQAKQEPERRFKRRLWEEMVRRRASLVSIIISPGETSTLCLLLPTPTCLVSKLLLMTMNSVENLAAAEVAVVAVAVVTTVLASQDKVDVRAVAERLP